MARRSARLQKPADVAAKADDSFTTAQESVSLTELPSLPEFPELPEPAPTKTPRKVVAQSQTAATPTASKSKSLLPAASRTPKNRTPIKPAGEEMHPALHHATTAKIRDEARWLGFQSLGSHTAPPKAAAGMSHGTPSKTPVPASTNKILGPDSSPDFHFRFKAPLSTDLKGVKQADAGLSPSTRNLLQSTPRKKAAPSGKMARFSDVHMAQFKKMDSIANHASAFRADPSRFKPVGGPSLKKTPSKPDLAKPESSRLKRTQSKMDLAESAASKTASTPLKRPQSTVRPGPSTHDREDRPGPSTKRVKRTEADDAASTRPVSRDSEAEAASVAPTPTPARKITSQTALPRLADRLMTPTKSSMARSQSVKVARSTSMIPSVQQAPSTSNMFSPTNVARAMRDSARDSMRKFSNDPQKVAEGTHMSPPPAFTFERAFPTVPATAPAKKHVNFSSSTVERAIHDELGKSPSPMKFKAGGEVPAGAVIYPNVQPSVQYPDLPRVDESPVASPSRRLTFGDETATHPRQFSFESGKRAVFGPASTGTIRMVRPSDASAPLDGTKRKLESVQEVSDKENDGPDEDDMRSRKKMKPTPAPPKTPASTSKLPRRTPGRTPSRGSAISKSRLAFLATPKRSKA
ncbi:hypothetical protein P153DRAFT_299343 [Dothidotthia symphoricarpi CBS 119687]|uniref:Erythromycin esterase n=1 Tax=Dothidotthia symphoricarpi CBS 119687 TaxID=1392245 RepID=A0A6A6A5F1_9PLEO|nr:uncharacterized protein P153DRAFT_299343 [Dothidotthia symphoricarpi CBS 119687]KAF2125831.1 hypothetical protein P153DRAFT_299343 [Dothidotthia symphoricarpi CBS 119687]